MNTWFTADTHFGHANIIRHCGRPFPTVADMDAALVAIHNTVVAPDDTVWWLGDVALGNPARGLELAAECNGRKILVCGNHDHPRRHTRMWGRVFDDIVAGPVTVNVEDDVSVLASHWPYEGDSRSDGDRFPDLRPVNTDGWLLHGHVHDRWRQHGRQLNVGVDAWAGSPVPEALIAAMVRAGATNRSPLPWPATGPGTSEPAEACR